MVASVPGVREPPQRLVEPLGEVVRDDDRVLGRLGEVGAAGDPVLDRGDDRGVGVAGQGHAVPAVEVGVLDAVDVVDLRAAAVADPHRLRLGDLPVRRGAPGQPVGPVPEGAALRLAREEGRRSPPRSRRRARRRAGWRWRSSGLPAGRVIDSSGSLTDCSVYATVTIGNKDPIPREGRCRSAVHRSPGAREWRAGRCSRAVSRRWRWRRSSRPAATTGRRRDGGGDGEDPLAGQPDHLGPQQGQPGDRVRAAPGARQHAADLQLRRLPVPADAQGLREEVRRRHPAVDVQRRRRGADQDRLRRRSSSTCTSRATTRWADWSRPTCSGRSTTTTCPTPPTCGPASATPGTTRARSTPCRTRSTAPASAGAPT